MSARRLWAHRDARRYLCGQALSLLGDSAMWLACGIWVKTLTGSNAAAAATFLFFTAPGLLAPAVGLLVDRVDRRRLLIAANVAGVGVLAPLLAVHHRGQVWLIYATMAGYGLLTVLVAAAQSALLTDLLPTELLAHANTALRTVQEGLRVLAPVAGAGLFALFGGRAVAMLDMATFLAAAALTAAVRPTRACPPRPPDVAAHPVRSLVGQLTGGFRHVAATTALRRVVVASAIAAGAIGFGDATGYAVISQGLHRAPAFIAILQTVQGVAAIAGGLATPTLISRYGEIRTTTLAVAAFAIAPALTSLRWLPAVLAGRGLAGLTLPPLIIAVLTLLQRSTPPHLQGRTFAAFDVATTGPQTIGIALGAALITTIDYRTVLAAEVLALACCVAILLRTAHLGPPTAAAHDQATITAASADPGAPADRRTVPTTHIRP